ncbi:hypothetical protein [Streptomyces sp. NPDC017260]|uniref:hypothetical protein n=1 Tax=unclassified Streptomyces TaxID=2593676 RepID=UPI0037A30F18
MPDPRTRRGIRHPWTALLTDAAAAVLAGAASITAIGEDLYRSSVPHSCRHRLTFGGNLIQTGTDSYRLAIT